MTIQRWLDRTTKHFRQQNITTAWLDSLLILEHFSGKSREWLLAHANESITGLLTLAQLEDLVKAIARRANREPLAYITGQKEFYGYTFKVNHHVLIPRPESENIIELIQSLGPTSGKCMVDVGTGCGALAIAAKLTYPRLSVSAIDVSKEALAVAQENAKIHNVEIDFLESNLLDELRQRQDIIVANLPYVPPDYKVDKEVEYEPMNAVFTESGGLRLIEDLIKQAAKHLKPGGYILIESLPSQMRRIIRIADKHNFVFIKRTSQVQLFRHWK
jgi:release factor glutamine methyltransferase